MTRSRFFLSACTLAALASLASASNAQQATGFGRGDTAVLTVDNIAGVVHQRIKVGDGDSTKLTYIGSLATFGSLAAIGVPPLSRIGFHYFVDPSVSLGSGLLYSDRGNLGTSILLAPRVGFAFPFGESSAFWLRAGMTWSRWKLEFFGSNTSTSVLPAADALFVVSPVEHFAFTVGAIAEVGVYGKLKRKQVDLGTGTASESEQDVKASQFGLVFGALVSF